KFRTQETFVRSVLEQTPNKIRHSRQELADWTVFTNAITHFDERAFDRTGHAVEQLELETAAIDSELIGQRLRVRDAANIVRAERGGNDRLVLEHDPCEHFKIQIAFGLLKEDRTSPTVLPRFCFYEIPRRAFDQTNCE